MSIQKNIMTVTMEDGTPDGALVCNMPTWDCIVYRISRTELSRYASHEKLKECGVYFLIGKEQGKDCVYVGQANARDNGQGVLGRVNEHNNKNEAYWTEVLLVCSVGNLLYATELNYLEHNFWNRAKETGSFVLKNASKPALGHCSQMTEITMEHFITGTEMILKLLGYKIFVKPESLPASTPNQVLNPKSDPVPVPSPEPTYTDHVFYIKRSSKTSGHTVNAKCIMKGGKFIVAKGSQVASVPHSPKFQGNYSHEKYKDLIGADGVITADISFNSPSSASSFVLYRSSNGSIDWKAEDGIPLKDFLKTK